MAGGMSIDIGGLGMDHADVVAFQRSLAELRRKSGGSMKVAIRRGTIALIKSLRDKKEGTKESPKVVPRGNVRLGESDPKYITVENTERRRVVIRKFNRARQLKNNVFFIPLRTKRKASRKNLGLMGKQTVYTSTEDKTAMLREARQKHGQIYNTGLARATWGWFMHALFDKVDGYADGSGGETGSRRVRIQRGRMVDGAISEKREQMEGGSISLEAPVKYSVDIVNKLSYIRAALHPGALERALRKANNFIRGQLAHWDRIHGEN